MKTWHVEPSSAGIVVLEAVDIDEILNFFVRFVSRPIVSIEGCMATIDVVVRIILTSDVVLTTTLSNTRGRETLIRLAPPATTVVH